MVFVSMGDEWMNEYKRLCDEHGLIKRIAYQPENNEYPTLSELLDKVEEKWPDLFAYRFIRYKGGYMFHINDKDQRALPSSYGESKELAVLKALISSRSDEDD